MSKDIVLDTQVLKFLLIQTLSNDDFNEFPKIVADGHISAERARVINQIIDSHKYGYAGTYVIVSVSALVEVVRKFDEISGNKYPLHKLRAFMNQPPDWFLIVSLEKNLFMELIRIPFKIGSKSIEWIDVIQLATALVREDAYFATADRKLKKLKLCRDILI